ncbi:MAG: hypothetical protein JW863_06520 [Chitinispirillaceae bacterium]|nr:hypothetical protein [Chitinispirillaceae bacterium]
MEYLFKILFGKGVATTLAALLFFSTPDISRKDSVIGIDGKLNGIFTDRVERIISTGTEVRIAFDLSLILTTAGGKTVVNRKFEHTIQYDNLKKCYLCTIDRNQLVFSDKNDAFRSIETYSVSIDVPDSLNERGIDFYIEASISYSSSLTIDIPDNALWDYYIPNKKIRNFRFKDGG